MSDPHAHAQTPAAAPHDHTPAGGHDGCHDSHHIQAHLKMYWMVGILLFVLTGVTVGLSYVDFGSHSRNVIVGMIVATIKVGFVAAIFMHLKGEKATIWRFLYFTLFFFAGLFLLTLLAWYDPIFGTSHAVK
jgi:caa(3)-type oxidase subunit IV